MSFLITASSFTISRGICWCITKVKRNEIIRKNICETCLIIIHFVIKQKWEITALKLELCLRYIVCAAYHRQRIWTRITLIPFHGEARWSESDLILILRIVDFWILQCVIWNLTVRINGSPLVLSINHRLMKLGLRGNAVQEFEKSDESFVKIRFASIILMERIN